MPDPTDQRVGLPQSAALFSRAPHPSAAKVALNWLLSREGQIAYQTVYAKSGESRDSMREDIPKDLLPFSVRRVKGGSYFIPVGRNGPT
jgi:ABC-type Fe3+ transport system substrate-binding protein